MNFFVIYFFLLLSQPVTVHAEEKPPCKPTDMVVIGGIDCNTISEFIDSHYLQISYCYKKNIDKKTTTGRFLLQFIITESGAVTKTSIFPKFNTLNNKNIETCVSDIIKKIHFPAPVSEEVVEVRYPFSFPFEKSKPVD